MERITRKAVDAMAGHVSALLPKGTFVMPVEESGRMLLELCHLKANELIPNHSNVTTSRTLRAGTKREMYEYCLAMREGILLSREGQDEVVDPASLGIDVTKEGWFTEYKRRTA